jgi:hypothetical protein
MKMRALVFAFQRRRGHSDEEKVNLVRGIWRDQDRVLASDAARRRGAAGVARADVDDQAMPRIKPMRRHYHYFRWPERTGMGLNGCAGSDGR